MGSAAGMLAADPRPGSRAQRQGRTLDETIAARPTVPFDATAARAVITPEWMTRLVYHGA